MLKTRQISLCRVYIYQNQVAEICTVNQVTATKNIIKRRFLKIILTSPSLNEVNKERSKKNATTGRKKTYPKPARCQGVQRPTTLNISVRAPRIYRIIERIKLVFCTTDCHIIFSFCFYLYYCIMLNKSQ